MRDRPNRLDLTWITLIALGLASVALARTTLNVLLVDGGVLALAAIKGRRILLDYLDLRSAPALWCGLATTWVMLVTGFAWAASSISVLLK